MFRCLIGALICVVLAVGSSAQAGDARADENLSEDGVALQGYDPVAYFVAGEPRQGDQTFQVTVDGVTYFFESEENKTAFLLDPERYAPAYGGYCAFGMRFGQRSKIDPNSWEIVDGKLYLLLNQGTRSIWQRAKAANINIANKVWGKWSEAE